MPQPLSGPGVGLPIPQNLYPSELFNAPYDSSNPVITLNAGDTLAIPAGDWYINAGQVSLVQYLDPQTNTWRFHDTARDGVAFIKSDGFTARVANLTGCPIGAVVTNHGSNYSQSTCTVTPSAGNSTWQPIIGGTLSVGTIAAAGSGFTIPPIVFIPGPPSFSANNVGGIQATASSEIANGTVSAVAMVNAGAGYTGTTVNALLLPSPYDPNIGSIQTGTVTLDVGGAGQLAGILCINSGEVLASPNTMTLTVAGGSSATADPVVLQSIATLTVSTAGAGYPDSAQLLFTTAGGRLSATDAIPNPAVSGGNFRPLPAEGVVNTTSAGAVTTADVTLYNPGLFTAAPAPLIIDSLGVTAPGTVAVVTLTMGGVSDTVFLQPAP